MQKQKKKIHNSRIQASFVKHIREHGISRRSIDIFFGDKYVYPTEDAPTIVKSLLGEAAYKQVEEVMKDDYDDVGDFAVELLIGSLKDSHIKNIEIVQ